jgi:hypothetical protein
MTASPLVKALDAAAPQQVTYCIPAWLRDEQIKLALARPHIGRLQPVETPRAEPCAVVGFGPSLRETWEEVRAFGPNVLSCSGSHKFLIEHGIVPRWHVEVDPREHKVALLGQPHPDVEYLLASTCHPKVFDHLAGSKVTLWHVFDGSEEGQRLLPYGEWAVTGGCDVGLRAMTMAAFLGFRDIHLFGLDGCAPDADAQRHAAEHPNGRQKYATCEYGEKTYYTTPAMLEAARQTFHELNQMPHVRATFHGTGLIQAMAQDYVPATAPIPAYLQNVVGFAKPELISAEYRALNTQLHRENLAYGVGGGRHAATVKKLRSCDGVESVLDYGAGKGYLAKALDFPIWQYDPAIPEIAETPRPADLVVCTDVLEHIEPERLTYVLGDLRRCVKRIGYFVIHTGPASKTLPDGRNTHLIQHGETWWRKKLEKFFVIGDVKKKGFELHVIVAPKVKTKGAAA